MITSVQELSGKNPLNAEKHLLETMVGVEFLSAFLECSTAIQAVVIDMIEILKDPETDADDRDMTLHTLAEALFPVTHHGQLGMDLEASERDAAREFPELSAVVKAMDAQEESFAQSLEKLMAEQNLTQSQLAEQIGVSQPAISNMLKRNCRPQRRTIQRLAQALQVDESVLWKEESSE